jgi:(p)ppGpp synthase/HD superfamily hydrolase
MSNLPFESSAPARRAFFSTVEGDNTGWSTLLAASAGSDGGRFVEKRYCGSEVTEKTNALRRIVGELHGWTIQIGTRAKLSWRVKSFESTWRKMRRRQFSFSEVLDSIGARVIVETTDDCYRLLDRVHRRYVRISGQQRDYIASPKANGYQSLHTTVRNEEGMPIEIQLRTFGMHEQCEDGAASHQLYKAGPDDTSGPSRA